MAPGLTEFLQDYLGRPMRWGVDDCSLLLADWWLVRHGVDPAKHLRGAYCDEAGKAALVAEAGGLVALVSCIAESVGANRTSVVGAGDFGVIRTGGAVLSGIYVGGGYWAVRSPDGVAFTSDAKVVRAWAI